MHSLLMLLSLLPVTQNEMIGLRTRLWFADVGGTIKADEDTINGTSLSNNGDLGFGRENMWNAELWIATGAGRLVLGMDRLDAGATSTPGAPFTFGGFGYSGGVVTKSKLFISLWRLANEHNFLSPAVGSSALRLSWVSGLQRYEGEIDVSQPGTDGSEHILTIAPYLGVKTEMMFGSNFYASAQFLYWPGFAFRDRSAKYIEFQVEVTARFSFLLASVGYRYMDVDLEHDQSGENNTIEGKLSGFFLGLGVVF